MSETTTEAVTKAPEYSLRKGKLGVLAIAFFVIAAAAPMAAYVGAGPVLFSIVGPATPLVYLIAAALIAVFAVGYLKMSQYVVNAGGFVAYISKSLGAKFAVGAAGIAVFTYLALQVGLFGAYGVFAQQLVVTFTGVDLPPLVWILLTLVVITLLTIRGVDASLKVLAVLIAAEVLAVVVLLIGFVANHGIGVFTFEGLLSDDLFSPGFGIALLFAILCFTTFEATVVFAEEAREPRKTIPRALYLVIGFVAVFYFVSTLATQGVLGADAVQQAAIDDPAGLVFNLATANVGEWLNILMQLLVVTSFAAMLLGIFNMFSRYLFALGRAGALPRVLEKTNKGGTPALASVVNGVVVGVILAVFLLAGADAWNVVYLWFSALGTVGFITILVLTSISVVVFFPKHKIKANPWVTVVAPVVSLLAFLYVAYLTWENFDLLSGGDPAARMLMLALPVLFVVGLIRGFAKPGISFENVQV